MTREALLNDPAKALHKLEARIRMSGRQWEADAVAAAERAAGRLRDLRLIRKGMAAEGAPIDPGARKRA